MSEPKYSVLLTDEQVNDLDLIRLVRQGKVNKADGNGYIIYNEKWHNEHFYTEQRGRGTWRELYIDKTKYYMCSVCSYAFPIKHVRCPKCKTLMYCGAEIEKEEHP